MTDHEKLREAVRIAREYYYDDKKRYTISGDEMTTNECFERVFAAAESTLPKTKMVEMKRWALFVHGKQANITDDSHMAEMWKRGCVAEDLVVEFTGNAEVPA